MRTGHRKGWVVDLDTGEIIRRFGDVPTPAGARGWARRAMEASGKVKTYTFEAGEQVPTTLPARAGEQQALF
ncbi:MAG: hypothetical protein ACYCSJ_01435 [Acidimicrobiales bacterium]